MPGVPSGRACDACRKQKKKCDQSQPKCTRCSRLSIPCIGSGMKRYKFIEDHPTSSASRSKDKGRKTQELRKVEMASCEITRFPSNATTTITSAFISVLQVKDARYDLSVYGDFLREIPSRLGTSAALDASVKAIATSYVSIYSRKKPIEAFENYGRGLKALRISLNHPVEANSANTICAFYLMAICQMWMAQNDKNTNHGEMLIYLLNVGAAQGWKDSFETDLLVKLCVPMIIDSVRNPKLQWTPILSRLTEEHDSIIRIESLKLKVMAQIPIYIRNPELHFPAIISTYHQMKIDLATLRVLLETLAQSPDTKTQHSRLQGAYSLLLSFANVLNSFLRALSSDQPHTITSASLVVESEGFVGETIKLATDALVYRPLGSSSMPLVLTTAWVATKDLGRRGRIEGLLLLYQSDFCVMNWSDVAFWLEERLGDVQAGVRGSRDCGVTKLMSKSFN